MSEKPENRLAEETSPYLLQHRHNPVDWYPWGSEALEAARREDKPIFLSIGYAACHWCHVMERESFEDPGMAELLNENFVSIKVDREERPDLDEIYMQAVQALSGHGGWPMSVFLTPDARPFWGGTYFPPEDRHGRPGFPTVLQQLAHAWRHKRDQVEETADQLAQALRRGLGEIPGGRRDPGSGELAAAVHHYKSSFDSRWGGFTRAPKFPHADALILMLREARRTGDAELRSMVEFSLEAMDRGGIHDQIGGGFHRYSTDAQWLVPHFEKMLYDQALIGAAYLEAWEADPRETWIRPLTGICDWVLRDMVDDKGGFHSSLDADSEGEEGRFYVWTPDQVRAVLGETGADEGEVERWIRRYSMDGSAHFEGDWIPHRAQGLKRFCEQEGLDPETWSRQEDSMNAVLRESREKRPWPGRDDKVLSGWNGLMISTLARAGSVLSRPDWSQAAERAAGFLLAEMYPEGRLLRSWRRGTAGPAGFLEDYAYVVQGLLDLHTADPDGSWLEAAEDMTRSALELFHDVEGGGFWFTGGDAEQLLLRSKASHDGATPSGTSVMVLCLLRLAELGGPDEYRDLALDTLSLHGEMLRQAPAAFATMLQGVQFALHNGGSEAVGRRSLQLEARAEAGASPGEELPFRVELRIPDGCKVASHSPEPGMRPARLLLDERSAGWILGDVQYPDPAGPEAGYWTGEVVLTGRLVVPPEAESRRHRVELILEHQLCDEAACRPADRCPVVLDVEVGAE